MKKIKQDKFILGQSSSKSISSPGREIRLDINLKQQTMQNKVYGNVRDINGNPIKNSLIKIMSDTYEPLMHTFTDANGYFSLNLITPNKSYIIVAIAQGYQLSEDTQFDSIPSEDIQIDFILKKDPSMSLAIIAGDIINSIMGNPIDGAIVSLYQELNEEKSLRAMTYTNEYGQYVFRELIKGKYIVEVSALGFNNSSGSVLITEDGQIVSMNIGIVRNPLASNGTVSGIITDDDNKPVARGEVILYRVNQDNSLTPIAFTKTNDKGIYLFTNVEKGKYKIKANQIEIKIIDIDADGTVSGIITDEFNKPISRADVILCKVHNKDAPNEEIIPVAYAKTDEFGAYLFKNIEKGTYKIRATKITMVTIQ